MDIMTDMITDQNMWLVMGGLLIAPFVQEDLAVVTAAGLSAANPHLFPIIFPVILIGLILSDIWKYALGMLARSKDWAKRYATKPKVAAAQAKITAHPGATLMTVRFIPFARIPAYIAAGFARVPYLRFCFWVALSAMIYIGVIFGIFHTLGMVVGEQIKGYIPLFAIGIVLTALAARFVKTKIAKD